MEKDSVGQKNLSVRSKVFIALVASMILLCAAILTASYFVIQEGFAKIEQDAIRKDISRLQDQLQSVVRQELVSLKDWSTWDESYHYAQHPNDAFINTNLKDSSLANLDLELVAYFDTKGQPIFVKEINHASGAAVDTSTTLAALEGNPLIPTRKNEQDSLGGFIQVPHGILEFGSLPLLQSTGEGPTTGSLVFARYLDETRVKDLADVLHLSVDAYPYASANLPPDVVLAKHGLGNGNNSFVAPLSASQIAGYSELRDVSGNPIIIFRITEARPIYAQGTISIATFLAIGGTALLFFAILMLFLLERLVISRFLRLTSDVEKVNDGKDLSIRVTGGVRDEIGVLAEKINQLLTWLSEAREAEAASRRETVNLLDELKKEKEQTEEMSKLLKQEKPSQS